MAYVMEAELNSEFVDVVFDGPPSHESGRFVECEGPGEVGTRVGEWIDRENGLWALRIPLSQPLGVAALRGQYRDGRVFQWDTDVGSVVISPSQGEVSVRMSIGDRSMDVLLSNEDAREWALELLAVASPGAS